MPIIKNGFAVVNSGSGGTAIPQEDVVSTPQTPATPSGPTAAEIRAKIQVINNKITGIDNRLDSWIWPMFRDFANELYTKDPMFWEHEPWRSRLGTSEALGPLQVLDQLTLDEKKKLIDLLRGIKVEDYVSVSKGQKMQNSARYLAYVVEKNILLHEKKYWEEELAKLEKPADSGGTNTTQTITTTSEASEASFGEVTPFIIGGGALLLLVGGGFALYKSSKKKVA